MRPIFSALKAPVLAAACARAPSNFFNSHCRSKQKTDRKKGAGPAGEHHQPENCPPHRHEERYPAPRADFLQRQIAWHLEAEVSRKEKARSQSINGIVQRKLPLHLQGGE